jgi:hypothetical protein
MWSIRPSARLICATISHDSGAAAQLLELISTGRVPVAARPLSAVPSLALHNSIGDHAIMSAAAPDIGLAWEEMHSVAACCSSTPQTVTEPA